MARVMPKVSGPDDLVAAGTRRLGPPDAGEVLTLQLAAWVREGRDNRNIEIPPLQDGLPDVMAALVDVARTTWGYREAGSNRLLAMVRTSPVDATTALIGRLGVVPDRFRQGLGGAMLRLAEARLPPGVTRVELVTGLLSTGNHAFYARHGYVIVARDPDVGIVHLSKQLR